MTAWLVVLTVLFPLVLALGYVLEGLRVKLLKSLPLAALPGLALALFGSSEALELPWLIQGGLWGIDDLRRVFLMFTALLWTLAGLYAVFYFSPEEHPWNFSLFWLLTLSGNLGLILAQDIAGFYTFFALMTLAAFGLVAHDRTAEALRAGRVYMVMALAGEMAILAGLVMAAAPEQLILLHALPAAVADSPYQDWIIALLFGGFGVKAGVLLLHLWLPLAHPAAPTPASAVLSGAMIKAGLFGWMYTLPMGHVQLPNWSALVIALGLAAALGGAALGVCQRVPKAVLAYSSVSQMGLMTTMVGVGLAAPKAWSTIAAAITLYAMHHGLAKGALFLSAGTGKHAGGWPRSLFWSLVWLPGLSLTGLVLTSGAAAKGSFKQALHLADVSLAIGPWLETFLSVGAVATTLLVMRYLWCLRPTWGREEYNPGLVWSWLLATLCSLLLFFWLPRPRALPVSVDSLELFTDLALGLAHPVSFLWPPVLGILLAGLALATGMRAPTIPPGDLVVPLERLWGAGRAGVLKGAGRAGEAQDWIIARGRDGGSRIAKLSVRLVKEEEPLRARTGLIFVAILVFVVSILSF